MEILRSHVEKLEKAANNEEQIKELQEINRLLLTEYMLEIAEDFKVYPTEIEAYYYNEKSFPDICVHRNELQTQKERFGKLYFHRKGKSAAHKILFNRGGLDLCLPNSNEYYLGFLIRSGRINDEEQVIEGPALLAQRVMRFLCKDNCLNAISEKEQSIIMDYEKEHEVVKRRNNIAKDYNYLIHSNRIGLGKNENNKYIDSPIRALTDLRISKQKEKDIFLYLKENFKDSTDEIKELKLKELLGYRSQTILDNLKYGK